MNDRDRGRGGRRRRQRGGPINRKEREFEGESNKQSARPTIILAKHVESDHCQSAAGATSSSTSASPAPLSQQPEKQVTVLKPRDEPSKSSSISASLPNIPACTLQGETPPQPVFLQRTIEGSHKFRDGPHEMNRCLKLIDEHYQWCEAANDLLLEQSDFLVVGIIGMQGSGKSTLMSLLAGNTDDDSNFIFPPQSREVREECGHMTNGIDIFVSQQRVIFLDTQPLMSPSVLEQLIHNEKKIPPEYTAAENYIEILCLQQVTFLLTVCNIIIVMQDWFTDMSLLRILQTAEMLKPSTPSSSGHDNAVALEDHPDYYPHIVFVQNKASREDFSVENFTAMQNTLSMVFNTSKLKMKGNVTMSTGRQLFGLNPSFVKSDWNLFILPCMEIKQPESSESSLMQVPQYRGCPSFQTLINSLRGQILAMPREQLTHTPLSEKNWFHYAARIWDAIKKSQMIAEYNRLLP